MESSNTNTKRTVGCTDTRREDCVFPEQHTVRTHCRIRAHGEKKRLRVLRRRTHSLTLLSTDRGQGGRRGGRKLIPHARAPSMSAGDYSDERVTRFVCSQLKV
jgi:hypothetical protein